MTVTSEGAEAGLVTRVCDEVWKEDCAEAAVVVPNIENPEVDLFVSRGGDFAGCVVCAPNKDGAGAAGLLGRPNSEAGSTFAG